MTSSIKIRPLPKMGKIDPLTQIPNTNELYSASIGLYVRNLNEIPKESLSHNSVSSWLRL